MDILGVVVAYILVAFATMLLGTLVWKICVKMSNSIKGKKNSELEESFDRMLFAFMKHKKDTNHRLQKLESLVMEEEEEVNQKSYEKTSKSIEIEEDEPQDEKKPADSDNLKNILKE